MTLSSAPSVHRLCLEFLEQISLCSVSSCMSVTIKRTRVSDVLESLLPACPQEHTLLFLFSSIFLFSSHSEDFQYYSLEFLVHPLQVPKFSHCLQMSASFPPSRPIVFLSSPTFTYLECLVKKLNDPNILISPIT